MTEAEELEMLRLRKRKAMAAAPPGEDPDGLSAFTRSAAQTLPAGFGNQLLAAEGVLKGRLGRAAVAGATGGGVDGAWDALTAPGAVDEYRGLRDELVAKQEAATERDPVGSMAGKVLGSVPAALATGGSTLAGAVGGGALLGGAQALGESEADLTRGEVGQALQDTAGGAAFGAAGGAAGHGLARLGGKVAQRIAGRAAPRAAAAGAEIDRLAVEGNRQRLRELAGKLGGEVQKGSRMAENLRRVGGRLDPADAARLQQLDPELRALEQRVAGSNLGDLPGQVGDINAAELAFREAVQDSPANVARLAAEIGNPMNQLAPRLQRYLPPVLGDIVGGALGGQSLAGGLARTAVGAGLGYAYGDTGGAVTGALAGAGMRPAFQAVLRGIRHPSVQKSVWGAVQRLMEATPGVLGRFGPLLGRVAASNLDSAMKLHQAWMASVPEYAEKVARALASAPEDDVAPTPEVP